MNTNEQIVLIDDNDRQIGTAEKLEAHIKGYKHRAFSVFLFNSNREFLLQQRDAHKYHTPGLWSNTCCSHPHPGEDIAAAARRRLQQEMGISAPIQHAFHFSYCVKFANGLIENETDHVFVGRFDGVPLPRWEEVMAWKYQSLAEIESNMINDPERFTPWFQKIYSQAYLYFRFLSGCGTQFDRN